MSFSLLFFLLKMKLLNVQIYEKIRLGEVNCTVTETHSFPRALAVLCCAVSLHKCKCECSWKAHMQCQQSSSGKYIKQPHNTD